MEYLTDTSHASGCKLKKRKGKKSDDDSSREIRKKDALVSPKKFSPLADKKYLHKECLEITYKSSSRFSCKKEGGKRPQQDTNTQSLLDSETN